MKLAAFLNRAPKTDLAEPKMSSVRSSSKTSLSPVFLIFCSETLTGR